MRQTRSYKGSAALSMLTAGNRESVILDNRQRTAKLIVTIRGRLTVAGFAAGAVRNGGRLSAAIQHAVNENGEDTWGIADAYMIRALAEFLAAQPLGGVTLPASAALPIGVYPLEETYAINFADPRAVDPAETYFKEADPSSFFQLDTLILPNAIATLVAPGGLGATFTLDQLSVEVEQVFATGAAGTEPVFKPRTRQLRQPITGTNPADIMYIKTAARLRSLTCAAEVIVAADGGRLIVGDAILALRLIGDAANANVIGPNQSFYDALVESQRQIAGGDVTALGAFFTAYFADNGRLANTIVPQSQFPNFRYEFSDRLSLLAVGSNAAVVLVEELLRKAPVNGYPTVSPELPDWLN